MLKLATKCAPRPLELDNAYRAGFRYVELWLDQDVLADLPAVLQQVSEYPNGYAMHFPNRLNLPESALDQVATMYRQVNSRCLVIHQPMADKYGASLLRLDPTMRLAVENHRLTPEQFMHWAERSAGLALDVEHLWKFTLADGSLDELLNQVRALTTRFGDKLRHVHLPGYWPGFREHRPMYCARDMIFPVLSILAEAKFDGLVVSEADLEYQNIPELCMDVFLFDTWRHQAKCKTPGAHDA